MRASVSGRMAQHGAQEPAVRVAVGPTPASPQERPPTLSEKDAMPVSVALTTCWQLLPPLHGVGRALARLLSSTDINGLLPAWEVPYSRFCNTSAHTDPHYAQ